MANDITSNPWTLNTIPFSYPYRVKITNLNITDATATDHVLIKDINGKTLVDFTASAGDLDYRIGNLGWVNGVVLTTGGLGASAVVTIAIGAGK
jgi:hypothetical protein